ncbi:MAG: hypothetical protein JSW52_05170 [Candidatus Coatesbacteria bacterium]|nr:MAG: hypothetical protein JSW52_05170 [Candidatus Coatesbacteria bacterium]
MVPSRPVLYYGQFGEVLGTTGEWVNIKCQFGEEGWVLTESDGVECAKWVGLDFFEARLTAAEAVETADDKAKEWVAEPYVVGMLAPLEDFGGRYFEWVVIYRTPEAPVHADDAFMAVTVKNAEADIDGAVWSAETETPTFINVETGEHIGYGLFNDEDADGRASLSFVDSDELFKNDLPEAVLGLPPVADGYPTEYFGEEPVAFLVLARDTWRVAYYDDEYPVGFTITVGCGTGVIKETRYIYEK